MKTNLFLIRTLSLLIILLFNLPLFSQNNNADTAGNKLGIHFTGFVKNDFWYDSRQVYTSREDLFLFYPLNESLDKEGNDINALQCFNFSAMTTRLTGIIDGPDAFGAKTSGMIEGDFSGVSNDDINGFRLRHAFVKLQWKKTEVLAGQFWHPIFTPEVFPTVVSLNTGAPFQPFIRNPQISISRKLKNFSLQLAFITQRDHSSPGPYGYSSDYMRLTLQPDIYAQLQYKTKKHYVAIGVDYKTIKPQIITDSLNLSDVTLDSYALMACYKYSAGKFNFKIKGIYGQNLTEHLMMGGYAVKSVDTASGKVSYTPTNHLSTWAGLTYGKKLMLGFFAGYIKNFGTTDVNTGIYYARGSDIDHLYRLSASCSLTSGKTQFCFEPEYTVVAYGTPDNHGVVKNVKEVANLRLLATVFYFF